MGERDRQTETLGGGGGGVMGHIASNVPSLYSHNFISKYTDRKDTFTCCEYARKKRKKVLKPFVEMVSRTLWS